VFTGEYRHTVDDKGRIAVPARFRVQLADGAVVSRWMDSCLAIHTKSGWELLAAKVGACRSRINVPTLPALRLRRCGGDRARSAGPGPRPQGLPARGAGLAGEAVVVGSRDHAEIWAPSGGTTTAGLSTIRRPLPQALEGLGI
jgi:MraZ protein